MLGLKLVFVIFIVLLNNGAVKPSPLYIKGMVSPLNNRSVPLI
jgi:hypothetical protein